MTDYIRDLRPAKWGFSRQFALHQSGATHVRFGSKADIDTRESNVRFTPESGHWLSMSGCPLCAKSRHSALR